MKSRIALIFPTFFFMAQLAVAEHRQPGAEATFEHARAMGPSDCSDMEVWDFSMGMCMPLAMKGMPMSMVMLHYNAFLAQTYEEGARGRQALTIPDMVMIDVGTSVGDSHYLNVDFMGTAERWTYPEKGYPLMVQIGEENGAHEKYIDAQHPHSSPIMGLTFSDTITLGHEKDHVKISFAPRGQSTDGPIAFMHRPTGLVNPDAPLGHHIGQDVGHITSTVAGAALRLSDTTLEVSIFNGTEPEPSKVDLPMDKFNSYAARLTHQFTEHFYAMVSASYVKDPEPHDLQLDHLWRYSASVYNDHEFADGWTVHHTFIYGLVNFYDEVSALNSFGEEVWLHQDAKNFWGRLEHLQRTPGELEISTAHPQDPSWVTALTLGYTHDVAQIGFNKISIGASLTKDFLPGLFRDAYGADPVSGKIFVQAGGMQMGDF